jgi:peptide/nickel transport system permease protein
MNLVATTLPQRRLRTWDALRLMRRPTSRLGAVLVVFFFLLTLLAPVVAPYDAFDQDLSSALQAPSASHPFGTDQYGRDILSRVMLGTRTALLAIVIADGLALIAGIILGLIAGVSSELVDGAVMRIVDVMLAFPYLLLALIIVAALGPSLLNSMIAIGIVYTPQYARVIRGQVLSVKTTEYVLAAYATGASRLRVMFKHILPNSLTPLLVMATVHAGTVVVETAGLSFLGLGAQPPSPDWGAILAEGQSYFLSAWWIATFPGLAIFLVVVGFNLLGDALRDHFDPRRRKA